MAYVEKDPSHPDFPHRTEKGYFRGCKDECCVRAHSRETKRRTVLRMRGQTALVPAGPVREHLQALLDADPHVNGRTLSGASGLDYQMIHHLLNGTTRSLRAENARTLMGITAESLAAKTFRVPAEQARVLVRGMMAQGWPGSLICERLGYKSGNSRMPVFMYARTDNVTRELYERVRALADEIGTSQGPSHLTAVRSKNRGWWPLAAYDEEGNLDLRHLPGHPWAEADDMVGRLLDSLVFWAENPDATLYEVSQEMGREQSEVARLQDRLRRAHGDRWHDALREAVQAYEDGEDGTYVALSAGLVLVGSVPSRQVPKDHPAVALARERTASTSVARAS